MKNRNLKLASLIAVFYLGMDVNAQAKKDTTTREKKIEEVVMIGYGTAKKRDLTGSISKIGGGEIADKPNPNPVASLQGKVAGLSIVNSGQPGVNPDIRLRGTVSRYNSAPLYVVDGLWADNLDFVNPNDIESIEVLKDASSLAIFGNRGANGVILVSTKKGKSGKPTINFSSSLGVKFLTGKPEMTNASQFKQLYNTSRANQGLSPYSYYDIYNADTDWIDEITNNGAIINTNNVSFSSSSEKNKLYFGLGYIYDEGLVKGEKLQRFTLSFNDEFQVNNHIKIGFQMNGSSTDNPILNSYGSTLLAVPIVSPYNQQQGLYNQLPAGLGDAQVGNPVLAAELNASTNISKTYRAVVSAFVEIKFLKDFTFKSTWTADTTFGNTRGYNPVIKTWVGESNASTYYGGNSLTSVYQGKSDLVKAQVENYLTWNKNLDGHNISAMAGYTFTDGGYSSISGTIKQYANGQAIPFDIGQI